MPHRAVRVTHEAGALRLPPRTDRLEVPLLPWLLALALLTGGCAASQASAGGPKTATEVDLASSSGPSYVEESDETPPATAPVVADRSDLIPVDRDDATWGSEVAPVTIVAFLDYQCPFCAKVQETLARIRTSYGSSGVRLVWKHNPLPFHERARPAAIAAQVVLALAGREAFFSYSAKLFENRNRLDDGNLETWAANLGITRSAFRSRFRDPATEAEVDSDIALAQRVDARGTPTFRINGTLLVGAVPYERFAEIIDSELAEARKLAAAGVPAGSIYARRVSTSFAGRDAGVPSRSHDRAPSNTPPDRTTYEIPIGGSPARGPKDAPVTIVAFMDFQCPFCKRAQATLERIRKGFPNDVRVVFKHNPLPFHKRAMPAAMLAIEALKQRGSAGFWEAHDRLFAAAPKLETNDLEAIARDMKLRLWGVRRAVSKLTHKNIVEKDQDLAVGQKVRGTPSFFVNGRRLDGARPFDDFKRLVDEELDEARALIRTRGIARGQVYGELMKTAKGPPPPATRTVGAPTRRNPSRGLKNAPIVLQMWSDFECPYCARVTTTVRQMEKEFGWRLRVVWRNHPLPFHPHARTAAVAAMEAFAQGGSRKFWKMHDLLFENQRTSGGLERDALIKYAKKLRLDVARFEAALDDGRHDAVIDADASAARSAGIKGTPAFVVNGYFISGAQPAVRFRRVIRRALGDKKGRPGKHP